EPTLGLAVGLSRTATPLRRGRRGTPASSPARIGHAARVQGGPAGFRHYEEGDVPQLASLVCDSPPRGRLRRAHDPGAARPQRREPTQDLPPRAESWGPRRAQPSRHGVVSSHARVAGRRPPYPVPLFVQPRPPAVTGAEERFDQWLPKPAAVLIVLPSQLTKCWADTKIARGGGVI